MSKVYEIWGEIRRFLLIVMNPKKERMYAHPFGIMTYRILTGRIPLATSQICSSVNPRSSAALRSFS